MKLILDWRPGSEHAFLSLAKERKTFEAHGISVEVIPGQGSSNSATQVDAGGAEFGLCAGETALLAFAKGKKIRSLAVFYPNTPACVLSLADKGIKTPEDLYEKRLGYIQGSSAYRNYEAFAAKVGLERGRIKEIAVEGKIEEILREDAPIDAMVHFSYQYPLQLELKSRKVNEIAFRDYGIVVYGLSLIVSEDVLTRNPDLAERMTRATVEAYRLAAEYPDDALRAFLAEYKDQDADYSRAKLQWVIKFVGPTPEERRTVGKHDLAGWKATADYLFSTKQVELPIDNLTSFFLTKYVP